MRRAQEKLYRIKEDGHRIRIAGRFLDEVSIPIERIPGSNVVSSVRFPMHNHGVHLDGDNLTLRLPPLVALQLFFDGTLRKGGDPVSIQVGAEDLGEYVVVVVESPSAVASRETAIIRLAKAES